MTPPRSKNADGIPESHTLQGYIYYTCNIYPMRVCVKGKYKKRGISGNYTPITLLLISKDTPAVSASAIQKAFHTPTAPKK